MNVETFFSHVNSAYRGSDDDAPVNGTPDFTLWLNTTNRKIGEWARDGKNTWQSMFDIRELGTTVTAGTQSYDLDDDLLIPSDYITVTTTDGYEKRYTVTKPQERRRFLDAVYIYARDPKVLIFCDEVVTGSQIVGGTISVPGYYIPEPLTALTDTVPVDDPYWLVMAVAAELARNDLTYESKFPDLLGMAKSLYNQMASNNRKGTFNNPRTIPTNVNRIPGSGRSGTTDMRYY